ncbi:ABZJ_00895 family protein [Psychrobacter sp. 1U1]|uniref:ABZJ_00895 family protein n=1 Tax=Psychrobacter sp. 1U1 TaxID=3453576 RepID=UPI003F476C98
MSRKTTNLRKSTAQTGRNDHLPNSQSDSPKLAQYIGFFAIGYILTSTVFMMIQTQVTLNSHLVTVLSIIIGAYIAVYKFIKHHKRALGRDEINRLVFGGVTVVWLLTAVYFLGIWFFLFDAVSREVLFEMTMQQPLPLLSALIMILVLTFISARISILLLNRLLDPKRKSS